MIPPVVVPLQEPGGLLGIPIEGAQVPDALLQLGPFRRFGGLGRLLQLVHPLPEELRAVPVGRGHACKGHLATSPADIRQSAASLAIQVPAQAPQSTLPHIRQQISPR